MTSYYKCLRCRKLYSTLDDYSYSPDLCDHCYSEGKDEEDNLKLQRKKEEF